MIRKYDFIIMAAVLFVIVGCDSKEQQKQSRSPAVEGIKKEIKAEKERLPEQNDEFTELMEAKLAEIERKMEDLKVRAEEEGTGAMNKYRKKRFWFDKKMAGARAMIFRVTSAGTEDQEYFKANIERVLNNIRNEYKKVESCFGKRTQ
jgi:DNA-binding transcriptional MerR regulator